MWNYSLLCATVIHNLQQPDLLQGHWHSFSLQRLWFRAQIGGTPKAPLVARKTNSGMKVPPIQ